MRKSMFPSGYRYRQSHSCLLDITAAVRDGVSSQKSHGNRVAGVFHISVVLKCTLLPAVFDVSGLWRDSGVSASFEFLRLDLCTSAIGTWVVLL